MIGTPDFLLNLPEALRALRPLYGMVLWISISSTQETTGRDDTGYRYCRENGNKACGHAACPQICTSSAMRRQQIMGPKQQRCITRSFWMRSGKARI